jgi:hypothetical protein
MGAAKLNMTGGLRPLSGSDSRDEVSSYPSFHYDGEVDLELPETGEMLIKFRKISETSRVDKDGKHTYACTVEVPAILKVNGKEPEAHVPARSGSEAELALDKIKNEMESASDEDGGDEGEGSY